VPTSLAFRGFSRDWEEYRETGFSRKCKRKRPVLTMM